MNSNPFVSKKDLDKNTSEFLKYLINNGGPEPKEYEKFTSLVNSLDPADVNDFREPRIKRGVDT